MWVIINEPKIISLFFPTDSLSWIIESPQNVQLRSSALLQWNVSLTTEEKRRANSFSFILVERELFLYSDQWKIIVVKQYFEGSSVKVGKHDTFDFVSGNDVTIRLKNISDTDLTRFRCTFLSSFSAPKSIIHVDIKGEISQLCLIIEVNLILPEGLERVDYLFLWIGGRVFWIVKCNAMFAACSRITIDNSRNQ